MNFEQAVKARTPQKRKELIEVQLSEAIWGDYIESLPNDGGFVDDCVEDIDIDESNPGFIVVAVDMSFNEEVHIGCQSYAHYKGSVTFRIEIDRKGGWHEVKPTKLKVSHDWDIVSENYKC